MYSYLRSMLDLDINQRPTTLMSVKCTRNASSKSRLDESIIILEIGFVQQQGNIRMDCGSKENLDEWMEVKECCSFHQ